MTVQGHRSERMAEEIRNEVSLMLAGELKDPRLAGSRDGHRSAPGRGNAHGARIRAARRRRRRSARRRWKG